jgi:hypothetical protein
MDLGRKAFEEYFFEWIRREFQHYVHTEKLANGIQHKTLSSLSASQSMTGSSSDLIILQVDLTICNPAKVVMISSRGFRYNRRHYQYLLSWR